LTKHSNKKTLETKCILADRCKSAGDAVKCTELCSAYAQVHSATGRHSLADIPRDYALTTMRNSPVRAEQPEVYRLIDAYISTFDRQFDEEDEPIRSVYLYSRNPGTGKTTTAVALLNEWIAAHYVGSVKRGMTPNRKPGYFFDVNRWQALFNRIYMSSGDRRDELAGEFERQRTNAERATFAVFDDIGVRETSEGFRAHLHDVINYRVSERLPTVYTSNVTIEELPELFGEERLADRIRDLCVEITFEGESRRGKRKTK